MVAEVVGMWGCEYRELAVLSLNDITVLRNKEQSVLAVIQRGEQVALALEYRLRF